MNKKSPGEIKLFEILIKSLFLEPLEQSINISGLSKEIE
jgi:hypothetical protein